MTERVDLFTREGHVSELSLARYEAGELEPSEREAVEAVLARDPTSQAMLAELRSMVLAAPPAPLIDLASRRRSWLVGLGIAVAASLAAWVLTRPPEPEREPIAQRKPTPADDGVRTKGQRFGFELWIDDGERSFRASASTEVHAGDKLAFRVYPRVPGQLLIVCIDPQGLALACHPSEGFASVEARGDGLTITPGLAFDAAPGEERFVALLCTDPPAREQVLANPDAEWPTCERASVQVRKAARL